MSSADCRLTLTQGPIQSIAAVAAVRALETDDAMTNVLVVGGLNTFDGRLVDATIDCAAGWSWDSVLLIGDGESLDRLPGPERVAQVLAVRNWQPFNVEVLSRHPEAKRIVYGDGIGLIDIDDSDDALRVEHAVATVPQIDRIGAADGVQIQVIDAENIQRAATAARAALPKLAAHDTDLAEFAEGGLLVLSANLTEAGWSTPRLERVQYERLVARARKPGAPVVIKGHPRATLAQTTTLARTLRAAGHPVRVVDDEFSVFPIEVFGELARSVGCVLPGISSSAISLSLLHDATVDPVVPPALAALTMFPDAARTMRNTVAHHEGLLAALPDWDHSGVIASVPVGTRSLWTRVLSAVPRRLFGWVPVQVEVGPAVELGAASGSGLVAVADPGAGVVWGVAAERAGRVREVLASAPDQAAARVAAVAAVVGAWRGAGKASLTAAALPSSHLPAWRALKSRRAIAPANARLSAERIEALLESSLEIEAREPSVGRRKGRLAPGVVRFRLRARPSGSVPTRA